MLYKNVIFRRVRIINAAVEPLLSSIHCACDVFSCPLWSVRLYHIFRITSYKEGFSEKKVTQHKMCFGFFYYFCPKNLSF